MRRARFAALLAIAALAFGVAACGGDDDDEPTTQATTEETTATDTTAEEPAGGGGAAASAGDASAGEQIFADNCATCHGAEGEGVSAPALTDSPVAANFDDVVEQVTNGGGGMPPFGGQLSEQEINDVAAYVSEELAGS